MGDFAILINSCDAYSDLWPTFFQLLKKNWPESNNCKIYLNTENTTTAGADVDLTIINTYIDGNDMWGKRVVNSLSHIHEEYVVVLMDDFFLRSRVDHKRILRCIDCMKKNSSLAVFYLANTFRYNYPESDFEGFGEIPKYTNFRLNSAPGLWKKEKLLKYIKETDNPWAWEYFGTCRTNRTDDTFFCVTTKDNPVYDYAHAIYRGKWLEKDMNPLIEKYHLDIDMSIRGIVRENYVLPKRSLKWKIQFIFTGIRMVGLDAIAEVIRDFRNAHKS